MSKRRLSNWLTAFVEWTAPVSESPESLLVWSALFGISSALKRKCKFSKKHTVLYDIWPTSYVMFVGPPGVVRKTTSAGYVEKVIRELNSDIPKSSPAKIYLGPTSGSHIGLLQHMNQSHDGSLSIIAGEFGNIVATSPDETYDFFAGMFDTKAVHSHSTRQHGVELVKDPSLNLLGCTTPDWIAENTGYMIGGGFAARTVFIFEYGARQRRLFYKDVMEEYGAEWFEQRKVDLAHDLEIIGHLKGEFEPENQAVADRMEEWYISYIDDTPATGAETFHSRKHIHAVRTAMLLSAAERDDLVITQNHFEAALVLVDDVEKKLSRGLSSVGKNPHSGDIIALENFIAAHEPVEYKTILQHFIYDVDADKLFQLLKALGAMKRIHVEGNKYSILR